MTHDRPVPIHSAPVSDWAARFIPGIRPGGLVLDLACGKGRHSLFLSDAGYEVLAVDRNTEYLAALEQIPNISTQCADLEADAWALGTNRFDGVVVVNYLHRALFPHIIDALKESGTLIYDTFAYGNETLGKPRNPDFLLQTDELLDACEGLTINAYEHGYCEQPAPAIRQRICATRKATKKINT